MYNAQGTPDKDQLVSQYAPLVKRIAYHLLAKLPPSVLVDDLIQNGMIGLLDAIARFEDGLGAQFETYAVQRVRGAMLDGLRENDWMPRNLRREMRRVEAAIHALEQQQGRPPHEGELAGALGMSLEDYQKLLLEARGHQLVYLEDLGDSEDDGDSYLDRHLASAQLDPLAELMDRDMREGLVRAIEDLPEREKMMMALYYDEELNLREIGQVLGVTESRICQLHTQAIARLRSRLLGKSTGVESAGSAKAGKPRRTA
jgi:RNA polymerase sigma factor for flagellar operon FliA